MLFKAFVLLLALFAVVSCDFKFTSNDAVVQIGSSPARGAVIVADTGAQKQEIRYAFGVTEYELYETQSRFQSCGGDCANYFLNFPLIDYGRRSGSTSNQNIDINGESVSTTRYIFSQDGFQTTLWVDSGNSNVIHRAKQTGSGVDRTLTFNSFTFNTASFGSPPNDPSCQSVTCAGAIDIMLVIDASGSIDPPDYQTELDYAEEVVQSFSVSENGVNIGFITFATGVYLQIGLSDSETDILDVIANAEQQTGQTNIGGALLAAHSELNTNGRNNVQPIIIIVTDGKANEPTDGPENPVVYMINQANSAKDDGILIYSIGVGNDVSQSDLEAIASSPTEDFTSFVDLFDELRETIALILTQVCVGGEQETCEGCTSEEFCGCNECVCGLDQTHCGDRGVFNSNTCECESCVLPYADTNVDDCSACAFSCQNSGIQNDDCTCRCINGFSGSDCSQCNNNLDCVNNEVLGVGCAGCQCNHPFGGEDCDSCFRSCSNGGTLKDDCTGCENCDDFYSGSSFCDTCAIDCNGRGFGNSDCTACVCTDSNYDGPHCNECIRNCQNGASLIGCSECECVNEWSGEFCQTCDYCGEHGTVVGNCESCSCDEHWSGDQCDICIFPCNGNGEPNDACDACICEGQFLPPSCVECRDDYCLNGGSISDCGDSLCTCPDAFAPPKCEFCAADLCNFNGHPIDIRTCTQCICDNDYEGTFCNTCPDICINGERGPDCTGCQCDSSTFWQGETCNVCDDSLTAEQCNFHGEIINGCTECRCDELWTGTLCEICNFDCHGNGVPVQEEACDTCVCDVGYSVEHACEICDASETADYCSGNGRISNPENGCDECECTFPYGGDNCEICEFPCNNNGEPINNGNCNSCDCDVGYIGENCETCDATNPADYCTGRGFIIQEGGDCDECVCETNRWTGATCTECNFPCANGGDQDNECVDCVCPGFYTVDSACEYCELDELCENGSTPNGDCTGCTCVGGYEGLFCNECDLDGSYHASCENGAADVALEDCQCACQSRWSGEFCDECDLSGQCNAPVQGGALENEVVGDEIVCQCVCSPFYSGENCEICDLDVEPELCRGISEPGDDCTCHCPNYYAEEEGCRNCIIEDTDCVPGHIIVGSTVDDSAEVCSCICDGNWSGRDCGECVHECDATVGLYIDMETCECINFCGDGIIVDEFEECENIEGETEDKDVICCDECQIVEVSCDDGVECTFDDRCLDRVCHGVENIDFTVDQDREPLPFGEFSNNAWSRWGVTVSTAGPVDITIYDSKNDASDSRFVFPSALTDRGGDFEFDNVMRVLSDSVAASSSVCFSFSTPQNIESSTVLSVARLGASVTHSCASGGIKTHDLINWGVGSAQIVPNRCEGPISSICYNNFANAAIAGIYTCENPFNSILGALGDYVWHDLSVDNIQDDIELGIPNVDVVLYNNNVAIASTTTDSDGGYLFDYLYAGVYDVAFYGPNKFIFSTPNVNLFSPFILHEGSIDNIDLEEGETDLTIDVGLYLFGAIGDYIFLDVDRDGTQNENIGVDGVTLNLYRAEDMNTIIDSTTTSTSGIYSFNPLPVYATPTTFAQYVVEMVPPPMAVVTQQYAGSNTLIDSNFDVDTLLSEVITLTVEVPRDLTIDGGIYYCCGSVGDFVFFDDNRNGIQDVGEDGVEDVTVVLFWNDEPIASQLTDEDGLYLFEGLELSGEYYVHFDRPTNYVWTTTDSGNDDAVDSDPNSDGFSHVFTLTPEVPDVLTIDAGIVEGCVTADECGSNDLCKSATCVLNQCEYNVAVDCSGRETNACFDAFCDPGTGTCIEIPTTDTNRQCDDENGCTSNDICLGTGECVGTPNSNPCNDDNLCTEFDVCRPDGECAGEPIDCNAGNDDPCVVFECVSGDCEPTFTTSSCDDEDPCTVSDVCAGGECAGVNIDCSVDDLCLEGFCADGVCDTRTTYGNCDDGNSCTTNDICVEGTCVGEEIVCESDDCHESICVFGECQSTFIEVTCDDQNACTENDKCNPLSEQCEGTLIDCEDNNSCTFTNCVDGNCHITTNPDGVCDDGDLCTVSSCVNLECVHEPIDCDDGNPCTDDRCVEGVCVITNNSLACNDEDSCTSVDRCIEGVCKGVPIRCDDEDPCTDDFCEEGECKTTFNSAPCDDGSACSPRDVCVEGECVGFDLITCEEENTQCVVAVCIPATGECKLEVVDDNTPCDNGNSCTTDMCIAGECIGTPNDCDDENPCTDDFCIDGTCLHTATTETNVQCTDGDACTDGDTCVETVCVGEPIICEDDNVCTTDVCVDGECVFNDNNLSCDDGNDCTIQDICVAKECVGTPLICVPAGVCFKSECVLGECIQTPNTADCNDGNPCTENDVCFEGVCGSNTNLECTSDLQCQISSCDIESGECIFTNIEGECDDGNACTIDDACVAGQCVGTPKTCDSGDVCLDSACDAATGECVNTPNNAQCDDGNLCTQSDSCIAGECVGGNSPDCSTEDVCTDGFCNPDTGACDVFDIENTCSDFDSCTGNDRCEEGVCVGDLLEECIPECVIPEDCDSSNLCAEASCVLGTCRYTDLNSCESDDVCVQLVCEPSTGECLISYTDNECDDGNSCTEVDFCVGGVCVGTQDVVCETDQCLVGSCDSISGECSYTVTPGNSCNDDNGCTVNDVCLDNGECEGTEINCDDGNPCTDDFCVDGGCDHTDNTRTCSDGDLCTDDFCIAGECVGVQIECEADECFSAECIEGECVQTPADEICDDGNACTINDVCINGQCVAEEFVCESDNVCVDVKCVAGVCQESDNTVSCDDGNACTIDDRCVEGVCIGQDLDCSDLDTECSSGACVEGTCVVSFEYAENIPCDDGNACTSSSVCVAGQCTGEEDAVCENNNPCSVGSCDPDSGCVFENVNISCEIEGNACVSAVCLDQQCQVISESDCNDGNICTSDSCDPISGECVNVNDDTASCSDNNPCTNDFCENGNCVSEPIVCDDNNACTDDICRNGECVFTPNFTPCEHENECVISARCDALGECATIVSVNPCVSENPCAIGSCDFDTGSCIESPVRETVSCDDNNACTELDICQPDMTCSGTSFECPISVNPCQVNVCDRELGCVSIPNPIGTCDTGSECSNEQCVEGQCRSTPINCSDNDLCTYDHTCTEEDGCVSSAYSCLLSPCVFTECSDNIQCVMTGNRDNWNPLVYIAVTRNGGRHFLIATSLTETYSDIIETVDPIISLDVKPYTGEIFAIGGEAQRSLLRVGKTSENRFDDNIELVAVINESGVDISFQPNLVSIAAGYSHTLWGMTRSSSDASFFTFDSLTNSLDSVTGTPNFYDVQSWDNHGRFLYGTVGKQLHAWNPVTRQDSVLCSGLEIVPEGTIISIDTRVDEVLAGAVQDGSDIHIFNVEFGFQSGTAVCDVSIFTMRDVADDDDATTALSVITAVAFDDTVCVTAAVGGVGSDGGGNQGGDSGNGQNTNTNAGGDNGNTSGNLSPARPAGNANANGASANSDFPGESTNYVLTGTTGQASAAVVGLVGAGTVAVFAFFAVVFGLNNTKQDQTVPVSALLETSEVSHLTADNPIFQGAAGAATNVLSG